MTAERAKSTDLLKMLEFIRTYGLPTVLVVLLLYSVVVPITNDYRAMAARTIEIQGQMADTLKEMTQVQANQARTLEELSRASQRIEEAVRRLDTRASLTPGRRPQTGT